MEETLSTLYYATRARNIVNTPAVRRCTLTPVQIRVGSAWFQLLKLQYDKLLSSFALNDNSRRYSAVQQDPREQLILSLRGEAGGGVEDWHRTLNLLLLRVSVSLTHSH